MNVMNKYRISPHCVIHMQSDNQSFVVVHGLHGTRFELSASLLPVLAALASGETLQAALVTAAAGALAALETLIAENVLVASDLEAAAGDIFKNRLGPIECAVQRGVNEGGYYATEVDHDNPPPVRKTVSAREYLELDRGMADGRGMDLIRCLETRRSIRSYADSPIPGNEFERFLRLTAGAYALVETPDLGWISSRNYPSGGARYPLEVYPLVYSVEGIEPDLYHYDPFAHRLGRIGISREHRELLLDDALNKMGVTAESNGRPGVLLLITAVYARTCWKYRGIPLQLILMETGALYQTMCLVATALGLAPCPLGAFPELAVAELLGLDPREENQVGLFSLGVPAPAPTGAVTPTITAVRSISPSPFGGQGDAIELAFSDGSKEIIDLGQLRMRTDTGGVESCQVRRGRHWAAMDAGVASMLRTLLAGARSRGDRSVQ